MAQPAGEVVIAVDGENEVIRVIGALDVSNAEQLEDAMTTARTDTVVDFTACDFIDSTGLAALMAGHRALTKWGRRTAIACVPSDAVSRILSLTGLERELSIHRDKPDALAALRAEGV
jgi:anti-sigma B factor antagonist